jgi:hypothetical protein
VGSPMISQPQRPMALLSQNIFTIVKYILLEGCYQNFS